jgi:hypothetical protein
MRPSATRLRNPEPYLPFIVLLITATSKPPVHFLLDSLGETVIPS